MNQAMRELVDRAKADFSFADRIARRILDTASYLLVATAALTIAEVTQSIIVTIVASVTYAAWLVFAALPVVPYLLSPLAFIGTPANPSRKSVQFMTAFLLLGGYILFGFFLIDDVVAGLLAFAELFITAT